MPFLPSASKAKNLSRGRLLAVLAGFRYSVKTTIARATFVPAPAAFMAVSTVITDLLTSALQRTLCFGF